jgi:hypothetical protein
MSEMFNPHAPATAYDQNTTIVAVLELSGGSGLIWEASKKNANGKGNAHADLCHTSLVH